MYPSNSRSRLTVRLGQISAKAIEPGESFQCAKRIYLHAREYQRGKAVVISLGLHAINDVILLELNAVNDVKGVVMLPELNAINDFKGVIM